MGVPNLLKVEQDDVIMILSSSTDNMVKFLSHKVVIKIVMKWCLYPCDLGVIMFLCLGRKIVLVHLYYSVVFLHDPINNLTKAF